MKKNINEELKNIKYLFNYNRGRVISEQQLFEDDYMELDEDEDLNYLKNDLEENEIETPVRPGIKTPTKPKKPGTPYSPKPGPKKNPKAKKGDMPDWLSFDELGINFE